jgi:D-amino peptidase
MKILIASDMEGITGVTNWNQVTPGHQEYARFRKLMTGDVNAAIAGAFEGGATEVVVADGHWDGANILIEELDPRARINQGLGTAPFSMMQGIDDTFDAVIFIGYHARAGSAYANLDHTWSGKIANVWLNDVLVGEFGLNGGLAGYFGVPVIMVSGDQTACAQTAELLGDIEQIIIKNATGRYSAECLPPSVSQAAIRDGARRAVSRVKKGNAPAPFIVDTPVRVTVEFVTSDQADRAERVPGSERNETAVSVEVADMSEAYIAFRALAGLASLE